MNVVWGLATQWMGLALLATLVSVWFRIATALSEIVVGDCCSINHRSIDWYDPRFRYGLDQVSVRHRSHCFYLLCGTELDPVVFNLKWKEATVCGALQC